MESYTGGTIVNGGTLQINVSGNGVGVIQGALTINQGGAVELNAHDVFGYDNAAATLSTLFINGGTLDKLDGSPNETLTGVAVTMNGGLWSTSSGGDFDMFSNGYGTGVPSITTLSSTNLATISANLNMRSGSPTFTVSAGSVAGGVNLLASGRLFGGNGITKAGAGVMELTNTNTYTGVTTINEGTLQAVDGVGLPAASNLVFNGNLAQNGVGAVLQSSGVFSRSIGTGASQVQWTGDGGFAANGGTLTVSMSPGTPLVWNNNSYFNGTLGFVPDGSALTFGSHTANSQVNFTDSIDLNGEIRQIDVAAGASGDSALISGDIIDGLNNGQGGLLKTGAGTLILSGTNTYDGGTTVSRGELAVTSGYALPAGGSLSIGAGGTFVFDPMANATPLSGALPATTGAVAAVPEPGTLALLASALMLAFAGYRRRMK